MSSDTSFIIPFLYDPNLTKTQWRFKLNDDTIHYIEFQKAKLLDHLIQEIFSIFFKNYNCKLGILIDHTFIFVENVKKDNIKKYCSYSYDEFLKKFPDNIIHFPSPESI